MIDYDYIPAFSELWSDVELVVLDSTWVLLFRGKLSRFVSRLRALLLRLILI